MQVKIEDGCGKDVWEFAKFPIKQPVPDKNAVYWQSKDVKQVTKQSATLLPLATRKKFVKSIAFTPQKDPEINRNFLGRANYFQIFHTS